MTRQPYIPRLKTTVNSDDDRLLLAIEREVEKQVINFELMIERNGMNIVYWGDDSFNYYRTAFKRYRGKTKYVKTVKVPASVVLDISSLDDID